MKQLAFIVTLLTIIGVSGRAQNISNYSFASTSGTYTTLSGDNDLSLSAGGTDEGYYNSIPIGFDFYYLGNRYTTVSASTNGWLTFDAAITGAVFTNSLNSGGQRPLLAPLWDDLDVVAAANVSYLTTGSSGSRVFTLQYAGIKWNYQAWDMMGRPVISFQVKLYESTGKVEFVYKAEGGATSSPSASVGIAGASGSYLSVTNAGTTVSSTTESSVTSKPATGRTYGFTPPVPAAPGNLTFTGVTSTGLTLNWTDLATNETGYVIYRSTDNVNFSFATRVGAGGTTSNQTGLTQGNTYYWRVYAVTEGGLSTPLTGSQYLCNNSTAYALAFDGTNDYMSVSNGLAANFTLEAWIKTSASSPAGSFAYNGSGLIWSDVAGTANDFTLALLGNKLAFHDGNSNITTIGATVVNDGNWHHIAVVRSAGSPGTVRLYLDGVQDAIGTGGNGLLVDNAIMSIGGNTLDNRYYNGYLDEVRMWNVARTAAEIANNRFTDMNIAEAGLYRYLRLNEGTGNIAVNNIAGQPNGTLVNMSTAAASGNTATSGWVNAGFAYAAPTYCNSGAAAAIVTNGFPVGGIFTVSPAGLNINASTGTITPVGSTPGTYTITRTTTTNGCAITATTSVIITAAPTATISYSAATLCTAAASAVVTRTGAAGGTYSSTPGLTLNAGSGEINPSTSTPGNYVVTYTIAASGGCAAVVVTTNVTIAITPAAPTVTTPVVYCQNATATTLTATGSNLTWGNGAVTGTVGGTASLTGTIYVDNAFSNRKTNFTTNAPNVTITSVDLYVPSYQSVTGLRVSIYNNAGTVIATSTAAANVSAGASVVKVTQVFNYVIAAAGNYSFGFSAGTGNVGSDLPAYPITEGSGTISVTGATMSNRCFNNIQFSVNNGSIAPTPSTLTPGTTNYLVSQTVNGCTSTQATIAVTINAAPAATIAYASPICKSAAVQAVTRTGSVGGTYSASPAGLTLDPNTGNITPASSTAGTYTVTYAIGASSGCAPFTTTTSVTITATPTATIAYAGSPYCAANATAAVTRTGTTGGTYTAPAGLVLNSTTGEINLLNSTTGTYTVTYTVAAAGGCALFTTTTSVTINAAPVISQVPATGVIGNYRFEGNANDVNGTNNGTLQNSPAVSADRFGNAGRSYTFNGTNNFVTTSNAYNNPIEFTISIWFKTASTTGGKLIGFGTSQTGQSGQFDRHIYMNNAGQLYFGVYPSQVVTVNSALSYNDNTWHMATATLSAAGMVLYVDGVQVGANPATTTAENYTGYWKIGFDNNGGWTSSPTNFYFNGNLDDALIYHRALTATEIGKLFRSPDGAGNNGPVCAGSNISLTSTSVPGATYAWTGPNSYSSTLANPSFTYAAAAIGTYQLTVTAAACTSVAYTNVLASSNAGQWTGNVSTDWADVNNWCSGSLPTSATHVTISATATRMPVISTATFTNNLTIESGASITTNATGTLSIAGTLANSGTMTNNGTTNFNGTSGQQSFTGVSQFYNLTVSNTSGLILPAAITVNNHLTIAAGTLNTNNFNITVKGNWMNNASATALTAGNALVTFNGTAAQTIGGTATTTFNNVTTANTSTGVTLLNNINVTGDLSVNSGILNLDAFTANRSTAGGILLVSNNATLKIGGTRTFPTNYATVTLVVNSNVEYSGTNQAVSNQLYGNLVLSSATGAAVKTLPATAMTILGNLSSNQASGTSVTYTAGAAITINGNVAIGAATTFNGGAYAHIVGGNWANAGTFNGNTSTITLNGAGTNVSGAGAQNFNNLTIAASAIGFSNNALTLSGNLATTGSGAFVQASGGTLTMTGTTKTITGSNISLDNLVISGSVTINNTMILTGNLTVSGTLTGTAGILSMSGTGKTISGSGTINFYGYAAPGSITTASNFSIANLMNVSGSFTASAGSATFTGTSTLSGTANLFTVVINGTSLQLSANAVLGIANVLNFTAGTLDVTSSMPNTVNFNGTGAQLVNAITYNKLTLSNGGTKTAAGAIRANNDLTIGTGTTFAAGSHTHSCYSDWINNGSFTPGTSTIKFMGTATSNIYGSTTFNILTVENSTPATAVVLQSHVSADIVNMVTGTLLTGTNVLTITNTRTGTGIIFGYIRRTHAFTTGVAYAFEGADNTITFTAVSGVTSVTVYVAKGSIADFPFGGSISRVYEMTVPAGTYTANLRLHYEDDELNGNNEATMGLWRNNGSVWGAIGKTANSTTANYVEQSGLTNITNRWTCSSNSNVVQWTGVISTDWNTPGNWTVVQGSAARPPAPTDIVNLGTNAFTNHPTISTPVTVKNINFGSVQGLALSLAPGGSLTSGDIIGTWTANSTHTINVNNQAMTIDGDIALSDNTPGHSINLNIGTGTLTLHELKQSGDATINFLGAGTLRIHDNFTYSGGTFTAGTGTVEYNGYINQLLGAVTYNHLEINKPGGLASISSATTVNGNLTITSGELDNTAATSIAGNVTIASGGILQNTAQLSVGGNWVNNGSFTDAGTSVLFNGSVAQSIGSSAFNNLIITKPVGTVATLAGNLVINGNITVTSGTVDLLSFNCNRSAGGGIATLGNNGTLIFGANNPPYNFGIYDLGPSSTVILNGTVPQAITLPGVVTGNLIFRNSGIKTLIFDLTVAGDLTIEAGSNFNTGTQTLTIRGNWNNYGTFTPSTSTLLLTGTNKTINGNTSFNKMIISGSYVQQADITYKDLLQITPTGSISSGGGIFTTMEGDLLNQGVLNTSGTTTFTGTRLQTLSLINATTYARTVIFNGTVSPVLNSTSTPLYGFLIVNNTAGVYPSVGWTIGFALTVGPGASFVGGSSTHTLLGSLTNNGTITSSGIFNFNPSAATTLNMGNGFSSTGLVNFDGTGAITMSGAPTVFNDVQIANTNAAGLTPSSAWTMTNKFSINPGAIFNAGSYEHKVAGNMVNQGTLNGNTSTFQLNGSSAQTLSSVSPFYNLLVNKASGSVTQLSNITVNNVLNFQKGSIITDIYSTIIPSGGSITNAAAGTGWVNGNLQKYVAGGATTVNFETGDANVYAPVHLAFANVSGAGSVTAKTFTGDHPAISSSVINASRSVNRYWTLVNNGTSFNQYTATFNFMGSDVDAGATTGLFGVGQYNGSSWIVPAIANPLGTSIQATAVSSIGTFAIGEICNAGTTIAYTNGTVCANSGLVTINRTGTSGGVYSAGAGLVINAATGAVNTNSSIPGTYNVTYTIAAAGSCNAFITNTSITIAPAPTAAISYNAAAYCANDGVVAVNFSGTTGGVFTATAGLSINSATGAVNISASTPGSYTVTYTIAAAAPCGQLQATANISISTVATWTGAVSNAWNNAANWLCGAVPNSTISVVIPTGTSRYPEVTTVQSVNNITIQANAYITVTGTLEIGGSITNSGIFDVSDGTARFNGGTSQTISTNAFWNQNVRNLVIDNNVTVADDTYVTGVLTIGGNYTLYTNDRLTIRSTASGTARVAPLPVDANGTATAYIVGKVAVERYIPAQRSWRILTAPLSNTGSIYASWQHSGVYEAGKGMLVTGPAPSGSNGLDASVQNTVSMKTFSASTQNYLNVVNTKSTMLSNNTGFADNTAYFTFVRGDRNPDNTNPSRSNETTLRSIGYLQTGKQVFPAAAGVGQYTIMGNPYAAPVNFDNIFRTRVMKRFYAWDPSLNEVGGYVVLDDLDGDGTYSKSVPGSVQDQYIQSGQGFFVLTDTAGSASITYQEQSKGTVSTNAVFRPMGQHTGSLEASLYTVGSENSSKLADAVVAEFNSGFESKVDQVDAAKFGNINETFSLLRNGTILAIERRPELTATDTLYFKLTKATPKKYQLAFRFSGIDPTLVASLEDKFTGRSTPVRIDGKTNYEFSITTDAASANAERFRIVFTQAKVLPVTFTQVSAQPADNKVQVRWSTAQQVGVKHFAIERSEDGRNFTTVATIPANDRSVGTYSWLDEAPLNGINHYRIRSVDQDGAEKFSRMVNATMQVLQVSLQVFPNPVTDGTVRLQVNGFAAGRYEISITAIDGTKVLSQPVQHPGGNAKHNITLPAGLAKGIYELHVTQQGSARPTSLRILVQ